MRQAEAFQAPGWTPRRGPRGHRSEREALAVMGPPLTHTSGAKSGQYIRMPIHPSGFGRSAGDCRRRSLADDGLPPALPVYTHCLYTQRNGECVYMRGGAIGGGGVITSVYTP